MNKFPAILKKEFLVLLRDRLGLTMVFLMPTGLMVIMSLIQDAPFRDYQETRIRILVVNKDKGELFGTEVLNGLEKIPQFVVSNYNDLSREALKDSVINRDYSLGMWIGENASKVIQEGTSTMVLRTLEDVGLMEKSEEEMFVPTLKLELFTDPAAKRSFSMAVIQHLESFTRLLQGQLLFKAFLRELGDAVPFPDRAKFPEESLVSLQTNNKNAFENRSSVQHNVPAWIVFGIFFMILPIAGGMIREKQEGSRFRMALLPSSSLLLKTGKVIAFCLLALLQIIFMLLIARFVLPLIGLEEIKLKLFSPYFWIAGISIGLASSSLGVLLGTVFNSYQQSSSLGAILIITMAALGGIWVPLEVMPQVLQSLGTWIPLYWSMELLNDVLIRQQALDFSMLFLLWGSSFVLLLASSLWKEAPK